MSSAHNNNNATTATSGADSSAAAAQVTGHQPQSWQETEMDSIFIEDVGDEDAGVEDVGDEDIDMTEWDEESSNVLVPEGAEDTGTTGLDDAEGVTNKNPTGEEDISMADAETVEPRAGDGETGAEGTQTAGPPAGDGETGAEGTQTAGPPAGDGDTDMVDAPDPNAPRPRKRPAAALESDPEEDEEMKDATPVPKRERVYFKRSDAPEVVREDMLRLDIEQYPDFLEIGDMGPNNTHVQVPMKDIFELRGSDVNKRFLPDGLATGGRLLTMVDLVDIGCMAGKHLHRSLADALQKDGDAAAAAAVITAKDTKGKGKSKGNAAQSNTKPATTQGKGKGKAGPAAAQDSKPPVEECIKAKFHLDTQTPHIELTTVDPDTGNIISTRIWAHELAWGPDYPWIGFKLMRAQPGDVRADAPQWEADMYKMAGLQQTAVHRVVLTLHKNRKRVWEGISDSAIADIRVNADVNKVRDMLIIGLDHCKTIGLNFSSPAALGTCVKWTRLEEYFRNLLMVAKRYGNLWFYRRQAELDEDTRDPNAIDKPYMPKMSFATPRWLGTEWSTIKVTEPAGNIHYEKLALHKWASLEWPRSYENVNEAAFMLKLAVQEERNTQRRNLEELVRTDGSRFFRGRFNSVNKALRQYSVEVYLEAAGANVKVPAPGTRISLAVDKNNSSPPRKSDLIKLTGSVVFDALDTDASFVCVVTSPYALPAADTGSDYSVLIEYIVDDLPYQRQIAAITDLQLDDPKKHKGPDALGIVFGCKRTTKDMDLLKKKTDSQDLQSFRDTLKQDFKNLPNQKQEEAAIHSTQSDTGNTVIVGPPGTGKTNTVLRIARAHGKLRRRVMLTAPTNSAVHNLVDQFKKHNDSLPVDKQAAPHEWVYFTGAQSTLRGADSLQRRQLQGEGEFTEITNAYFAHLRDAQIREKAPWYKETFGYKLSQCIETWKSDPKFDGAGPDDDKLYSWSTEYERTKAKARFITDAAEFKEAQKHLTNLEAWLSYAFFKKVRYCFCTLSTSAHPLVLESGDWEELIVDEAARETRAGIATVLGALCGRISHITFSGDFNQGEGIIIGGDSNVGFKFLSRNIFAEIADISVKKVEAALSLDVFTLDICYRMAQNLIQWSSTYCYGGVVQSHPSATQHNPRLRKTLRLYWEQRTREDFKGQYDEIGLDINCKAELVEGGTTWYNTGEAEAVAWLIKDMILFEPPALDIITPVRRIVAKDFLVTTNYTGQVAAIRKALRKTFKGQEKLKPEDTNAVTIVLGTVSSVQGQEADISIYSMCIANGTARLERDEHLGIGFVAQVKNYNVAITRQRVARYIVGSFKLFTQAIKDKHSIIHKHGEFFAHIRQLWNSDFIVSEEELAVWRDTRAKPDNSNAFTKTLVEPATMSGRPMERPDTSSSALHGTSTGVSTTGLAKSAFKKSAPAAKNFAGDRDKSGMLKAGADAKVKKQKSKGVKHREKRQARGDDDNNDPPTGGSATAA